jgi:hypothetical protein
MRTLEILSKKLKFVDVDPLVKASKALKDVQPELEKLRQKAVSKVIDYNFQMHWLMMINWYLVLIYILHLPKYQCLFDPLYNVMNI